MRITDVEVIPLACPLPQKVYGGTYEIAARYTNVTRIYTDAGIVGETYAGDPQTNQKEVVRLVDEVFRRELLGEDPLRIERIWSRLFRYTVAGGGGIKFEAIASLDLSLRAAVMQAIAAVDIALWDVLGKAAGLPVYRLLGGFRDEVPIIAIGGYYQPEKGVKGLVEEALRYKSQGLAGVKLKVGRASVEEDVERLRAVREAVGDRFLIACDANQAWAAPDAVRFVRLAEPYGVCWLEEPVQWHNEVKSLAAVRRRSPIPIAAGQGEITRYGCWRLLENGAVDILNVDASIAGGVTEWRRISALASVHEAAMAHHEEWQIASHLLASIPHGLYAECFPTPLRDPLWEELPKQRPAIKEGRLQLPDRPGFGLELNSATIEKYRAEKAN